MYTNYNYVSDNNTFIDESEIKLRGNSVVITLKRDALRVYGLDVGSKIEIVYKYPEIIIRKKQEDKK